MYHYLHSRVVDSSEFPNSASNQDVDVCRRDSELACNFLLRIGHAKWGEYDGVLECEILLSVVVHAFELRIEDRGRGSKSLALPRLRRDSAEKSDNGLRAAPRQSEIKLTLVGSAC